MRPALEERLVLQAAKLLEDTVRQLARSKKPKNKQRAVKFARQLLAVSVLLRQGRDRQALEQLMAIPDGERPADLAKHAAGPSAAETGKRSAARTAEKETPQAEIAPPAPLEALRQKLANIDGQMRKLEAERQGLRRQIRQRQQADRATRERKAVEAEREAVRRKALQETQLGSLQLELAWLEQQAAAETGPAPALQEKIFRLKRAIFEKEAEGKALEREQIWCRQDRKRLQDERRRQQQRQRDRRWYRLQEDGRRQDLERQLRMERLERQRRTAPSPESQGGRG